MDEYSLSDLYVLRSLMLDIEQTIRNKNMTILNYNMKGENYEEYCNYIYFYLKILSGISKTSLEESKL